MRRESGVRWAVSCALAGVLALGAKPARAHLIPARQGTVNVVGAAVYTVLSVPASALHGADDNHDGVLDMEEFTRHEALLRAEIDERLVILDGATVAKTVRVDLILSHGHDGPGDRADQVVALKHAELGAPPSDLRVRTDLFGAGASEQELTITATRHPATGTETKVGIVKPGATEYAFFPPAQPALQGASVRVPRGFLGMGAIVALAAGALVIASRTHLRRSITRAS